MLYTLFIAVQLWTGALLSEHGPFDTREECKREAEKKAREMFAIGALAVYSACKIDGLRA